MDMNKSRPPVITTDTSLPVRSGTVLLWCPVAHAYNVERGVVLRVPVEGFLRAALSEALLNDRRERLVIGLRGHSVFLDQYSDELSIPRTAVNPTRLVRACPDLKPEFGLNRLGEADILCSSVC